MLIQRGSVTTAKAAQITGADRRVALDDLKALEQHMVPVSPRGDGRDRQWMLQDAWRAVGLPIGLRERLAMRVGRELVGGFLHHTEVGEALERLDLELSHLDAEAGDRDELGRRFHFIHEPSKDYSRHREALELVIEALLGSHPLSFDYRSPGRAPKPYPRIEPLTLIVYKRGVYLACERRRRFRTFAVERMSAVAIHRDERFAYPRPSEYDPAAALDGRYGLTSDDRAPERVVLRFEREVRTFVETREWVPGQRVRPHPDGGCDLEFDASGRELVSLVTSFGDKVEVMEPEWLRERVRDELERALARYGATGSAGPH